MPESKISMQLTVANLNTTEAFYRGLLDLPLQRAITARGAPEHLVMRHDGWELIFVEEEAVIRTHPVLEESISTMPKGVGMTIHLRVKDIEDIYAALLDEELQIIYPLVAQPYGMKEFWCLDPDGYVVVLEERWR